MHKMNNLSFVGMVGGLIFTVLVGLRYFAIYPDLDRAIIYGIVGVLIIIVSFLYARLRSLEDTLLSVENYLADRPWELQV